MTDDYYLSSRIDESMAALETERRRLDDLGRVWEEESTTVKARDQSFSMTFDGRGELTGMTFNGTRYRNLAPAELAHLVVATLQAGRLESLTKMAETMSGAMPGVDFVALATGKVDPRTMLDSMIEPMMSGLRDGTGIPEPQWRSRPDRES